MFRSISEQKHKSLNKLVDSIQEFAEDNPEAKYFLKIALFTWFGFYMAKQARIFRFFHGR